MNPYFPLIDASILFLNRCDVSEDLLKWIKMKLKSMLTQAHISYLITHQLQCSMILGVFRELDEGENNNFNKLNFQINSDNIKDCLSILNTFLFSEWRLFVQLWHCEDIALIGTSCVWTWTKGQCHQCHYQPFLSQTIKQIFLSVSSVQYPMYNCSNNWTREYNSWMTSVIEVRLMTRIILELQASYKLVNWVIFTLPSETFRVIDNTH